jgi:hypothetical protein
VGIQAPDLEISWRDLLRQTGFYGADLAGEGPLSGAAEAVLRRWAEAGAAGRARLGLLAMGRGRAAFAGEAAGPAERLLQGRVPRRAGPLALRRRVPLPRGGLLRTGAVGVLARLGPGPEAARLLPVLRRDAVRPGDPLLQQAAVEYWAALGEAALPDLQARTAGRPDLLTLRVLGRLGRRRPELREACVQALVRCLEPGRIRSAQDDALAAAAVAELVRLEAREAWPAVRAAYERDDVLPVGLTVRGVWRRLGDGPEPEDPYADREAMLLLRCLACGRSRPHAARSAVVLTNVLPPPQPRDAEEVVARRFGMLVVPHPLRCPRCGAVNRWAVAGAALAALLQRLRRGPGETDSRWWWAEADTPVGAVHPAVAAFRLRRQLQAEPRSHALRLRLGRTLRTCGFWDEAAGVLRTLAEAAGAPTYLRVQAAWELAALAAAQGQREQALHWCQVGLGRQAVAGAPLAVSVPPYPDPEVLRALRQLLAEVRTPWRFRPADAFRLLADPARADLEGVELRAQGPVRPSLLDALLRNSPCPCGSGRKYKRCCGLRRQAGGMA